MGFHHLPQTLKASASKTKTRVSIEDFFYLTTGFSFSFLSFERSENSSHYYVKKNSDDDNVKQKKGKTMQKRILVRLYKRDFKEFYTRKRKGGRQTLSLPLSLCF